MCTIHVTGNAGRDKASKSSSYQTSAVEDGCAETQLFPSVP
jgi:hypothetical protein